MNSLRCCLVLGLLLSGLTVSASLSAAEPTPSVIPVIGPDGQIKPAVPKPATPPPISADSRRAQLIEFVQKNVSTRYAWIFRELKLKPETEQELKNLIAQRQLAIDDALAGTPSATVQDPGDPTHYYGISNSDHLADARKIASVVAPIDAQVHALLGDRQYPIYQHFIDTFTIRLAVINRLQNELAQGGDSLDENQSRHLLDALAAANNPLTWIDATRAFITDAVVQEAQSYLNATQLAALKNTQVVRVRVQQAVDQAMTTQNFDSTPNHDPQASFTNSKADREAMLKATAGKTYAIDFSVPYHAGDHYALVRTRTLTVRENTDRDISGPTAPLTDTQGSRHTEHLEGDVEVMAVFPNGGVQKASLLIKVLSYITDDRYEQNVTGNLVGHKILPTGTKVVAASLGGKTIYTVDGKPPASTEIAATLQSVFALEDGKITDQAAFGPLKPVSVSLFNSPDSGWAMDGAKAVAKLVPGMTSETTTGSGQLHLNRIPGTDANPVASFYGTLTLKNLRGPFAAPILTKTGSGSVQLNGQVPAQHKGTSTMRMSKNFDFDGGGPDVDGTPVMKHVEMEDILQTDITYP